MILTCPDCASRYVVDDARIGVKGRIVRCTSCSSTWHAMPQTPAIAGAAADPLPAESLFTGPDVEPVPRPAPLPTQLRAQAEEKRKSREAVVAGVVWAALGAGFVAIVLGAVLFRVDMVRLWPQTASAYAFAKMPVNPTGLAIETVQGQPNLIGGHVALSVTGVERNVEMHARLSMPLRVAVYDKGGRRLTSSVYAPPAQTIAPGETRAFAVNFIDPPQDSASFVVEFAFDKVAMTRTAPPKPTAKILVDRLNLRGPTMGSPAPVIAAAEAKPLPASSPYALPASATPQNMH